MIGRGEPDSSHLRQSLPDPHPPELDTSHQSESQLDAPYSCTEGKVNGSCDNRQRSWSGESEPKIRGLDMIDVARYAPRHMPV